MCPDSSGPQVSPWKQSWVDGRPSAWVPFPQGCRKGPWGLCFKQGLPRQSCPALMAASLGSPNGGAGPYVLTTAPRTALQGAQTRPFQRCKY